MGKYETWRRTRAGVRLTWVRRRLRGWQFAFTFVGATFDPDLSGLTHTVHTRVCETILLTSLARTCLVAPLTGGGTVRALVTKCANQCDK